MCFLWLLSCYNGRLELLQQRPSGPQSLKYLLNVPLQKKFADPWSREKQVHKPVSSSKMSHFCLGENSCFLRDSQAPLIIRGVLSKKLELVKKAFSLKSVVCSLEWHREHNTHHHQKKTLFVEYSS